MVTPLGSGVETTWKRLIEGKCGIRAKDLKMNNFDRETQLHVFDQLNSKVAVFVPCGTNLGESNEDLRLNSKDHRSISRFIGYALCAAYEALKDANWVPTEQEQKEKAGVSVGGGIGSIPDILDASQMICDKGPNHAAVTACATGAHSIGNAARMIQFGDADVMVAGGTESSIDALSVAGFCRSRALTSKFNSTPLEASQLFDCDQDGFVIGEGGGVLLLEELEHARERSAKIYAKGAIGHLLGAAGAVEGIAPLTLNLTKPDPIFKDKFIPLTATKEMPIRSELIDMVANIRKLVRPPYSLHTC